jgi:flavin-dependent dehydrogenase
MNADGKIGIVGMGLAGSCLAWRLEAAGMDFAWADDAREGSASRVAAGLLNPVTGRNFEPSWRIEEFLPRAVKFFREAEARLDRRLWFPLPVVRLVSGRDWEKVARKLGRDELARWVERVDESVSGWRAAVILRGGGRFDAPGFCRATREFFASRRGDPAAAARRVSCEGAAGLMAGQLGAHRCAKGEILTLRMPGGDESRILVGGGGWLVPAGSGLFKAGATYEWDRLDGVPTAAGRTRIGEILAALGVTDYEIVAHEAGVRPIVRRSMPLIGPLADGRVVFNGLGSKGSLYAPGAAEDLTVWLAGKGGLDAGLDVREWQGNDE